MARRCQRAESTLTWRIWWTGSLNFIGTLGRSIGRRPRGYRESARPGNRNAQSSEGWLAIEAATPQRLEARPGIEPGLEDLAWLLRRHSATGPPAELPTPALM